MQKPCTIINKEDWPPNYVSVFSWRQRQLEAINSSDDMALGALVYYRDNPVDFINHWCDTYDPRNAGSGKPTRLPLVLFKKQDELVRYLNLCIRDEEHGLIEKCRDMGATWVSVAFSVWLWIFLDGASIGWGSRKEQLVDKIGDPDSIFEKIRLLLKGLPSFFLPAGFNPDRHLSYMKIINPENGATITGEAGDNIGRGGRKLVYFKDESAHYERPELIEAALADNTRVQIDISSVNGLGNVFHRRREAGQDWYLGCSPEPNITRVFVMDWSEHPEKTQEWYNARREKAEREGMLHIFAQEIERNYSSSVEGVVIPAEWVKAAIDAHLTLNIAQSGAWGAGLDVADEGIDKNALAKKQGVILRSAEDWGARDTAKTARKAVDDCSGLGKIAIQYDSIGVGSGIKAEVNNLMEDAELGDNKNLKRIMRDLSFVSWNAGSRVIDPDDRVVPDDSESPTNKDVYENLVAQAWWDLRMRFYRTYRAVVDGIEYNESDLISLDSSMPNLRQIEKELSQATASKSRRLKITIDKKPKGTKSPNLADAIVMAYFPLETNNIMGMLLPR